VTLVLLQPVPGKMRLEMVIGMQNEILDGGPGSCLFSNEQHEKRPVVTIRDFVLYSVDHFESYLLRIGLYIARPKLSSVQICAHFSNSVHKTACLMAFNGGT